MGDGTGRRIGTVGRLVREKNYPLLVRAVAPIRDAELVFVGDGPLRSELQQQAGPQAQFLLPAANQDAPSLGIHSDNNAAAADTLCQTREERGVYSAPAERRAAERPAIAGGCPAASAP